MIHSHVWVGGGDPPGRDLLWFSVTWSDPLAAPEGAGLLQSPGSLAQLGRDLSACFTGSNY